MDKKNIVPVDSIRYETYYGVGREEITSRVTIESMVKDGDKRL